MSSRCTDYQLSWWIDYQLSCYLLEVREYKHIKLSHWETTTEYSTCLDFEVSCSCNYCKLVKPFQSTERIYCTK